MMKVIVTFDLFLQLCYISGPTVWNALPSELFTGAIPEITALPVAIV